MMAFFAKYCQDVGTCIPYPFFRGDVLPRVFIVYFNHLFLLQMS